MRALFLALLLPCAASAQYYLETDGSVKKQEIAYTLADECSSDVCPVPGETALKFNSTYSVSEASSASGVFLRRQPLRNLAWRLFPRLSARFSYRFAPATYAPQAPSVVAPNATPTTAKAAANAQLRRLTLDEVRRLKAMGFTLEKLLEVILKYGPAIIELILKYGPLIIDLFDSYSASSDAFYIQ